MYTLVQHSGYGAAGKADFARAVEEAPVSTKAEADRVRRAGGLLFTGYSEASRYSHEINYPPGVHGIVPRAKGTFHPRVRVGGLRLYVPSEWDLALVSVREIMES
jgi:hypothetical protein